VSHGDQTTPLTTVIPSDLGEEGEEYSELTTGMWNPIKSINTNGRDRIKIQENENTFSMCVQHNIYIC